MSVGFQTLFEAGVKNMRLVSLVCLLPLSACSIHATEVRVESLAAVGLDARANDASSTLFEPGSSPGEVNVLEEGRFSVVASRHADGSMEVSCPRCKSRTMSLLEPDGTCLETTFFGEQSLTTALESGEFRLFYEYDIESIPGYYESYLDMILVTPAANVRSVVDRSHPMRGFGLMLLPGVAFTGTGLLLLSGPGAHGLGATFLTIGLGTGGWGAWQLFSPAKDQVIYDATAPLPPSTDGS